MTNRSFENQEQRAIESKEYTSARLATALQQFSEHFGEPRVIYYPSSSTDVTPATTFPNSRVIFLDIDQDAVQTLRESGKEAVEASAETYIPDVKVDLLILSNPAIGSDRPARHVDMDGFVFCNNWHSSATQMANNGEFKLVGIIVEDKNLESKLIVGDAATQAWSEGMGVKNVDNYFVFKRIKENAQTDEEALKEYESLMEERKKEIDDLVSDYKNAEISLDDI